MKLTVLGSTGSIGTQTLAVAREIGAEVGALSAGRNLELLAQQVKEYRPAVVSVSPEKYAEAKARLTGVEIVTDPAVLATHAADVVVNAIGGLPGLAPTRAALEAGQAVALATKEAMVTAAPLIWEAAQKGGGRLIPIDSEHTGVFQCLLGERLEDVAEIILTASGGPFRQQPADLSDITPQQALKHPSWSMGQKITIDSATLMNKGLEVMESAALYGVPLSKVKVVVHPQSILHGAVRLKDGSLKGQFGPTDMRLPIAYAIAAAPYGMRHAGDIHSAPRAQAVAEALQWPLTGEWQFFPPDFDRFPCLGLAYRAGEAGGLLPAALNAADEVAVPAFLAGNIGFLEIPRIIQRVLDETPTEALTWDALAQVTEWASRRAQELVKA